MSAIQGFIRARHEDHTEESLSKRTPETSLGGRQDSVSRQALQYLMWVLLAGILALLVFSAQAQSRGQFLSFVGTGIMFAGASLFIGAVLGFLFGIPRTVTSDLQKAPPPANPSLSATTGGAPTASAAKTYGAPDSSTSTATRYMPNPDLEQIADWLTKILVGVGLTQLGQIPGGLEQLKAALRNEIGGDGTFAVSLALYFVLCGFLIGFLWTRLYFPQALHWSDEASEAMNRIYHVEERSEQAFSAAHTARLACERAVEDARERQDADKAAVDLVIRQLTPWSGLPELNGDDLRTSLEKATPLTRERIFHEAATVRSTNWKANTDLMLRTIPIFQALIDIDSTRFEYYGELGFAFKDKGDYRNDNDAYKAAVEALNQAIKLRPQGQLGTGAAWYEYLRAVCLIHLDKEFQNNRPTTGAAKLAICQDLETAAQTNLSDAMAQEHPALNDWIRLNKLEKEFPLPAQELEEHKELATAH